MAVASFGPTAGTSLLAKSASSNVVLPTTGTPTIVAVTNLGQSVAFVALGSSNAVAAVAFTSMPVLSNQTIFLTISSNTYLAGITLDGECNLSIIVGN